MSTSHGLQKTLINSYPLILIVIWTIYLISLHCVSVVGMTEFARNSSTILQIKSKKSTPLSLPELFSFMPYGPDSSLSHVKVSWATPSSPITAEVALKHAWSERAYTKYAYEFCTRVIEQEGKSNPWTQKTSSATELYQLPSLFL